MGAKIEPLPPFTPDLYQRAWASVPHPTLPLLATAHANSVTVFSLSTLSKHSALTGGHSRSVRTVTWQPGLKSHQLRLVTGSFDASAGLWSWNGDNNEVTSGERLEVDVTKPQEGEEEEEAKEDWEFNLVLEGHENEIKSVAFSPSGQFLATCSRDKTVWIWEDVGVEDDDDEWETLAVLNDHDADVKAVAWAPDVPGRTKGARGKYSADVLASASYDNTVRIWREEGEGEWVCVACLEGHNGTVWGLQFESCPRRGDKFPRLLTWSADGSIRIWSLKEEPEEEGEEADTGSGATAGSIFRSGLGGIPNTMRRSLREDWECTAVLPKVHTREIYSATWSAKTGMIASTGSDGTIALYAEVEADGDTEMANTAADAETKDSASPAWKVLTTVPVAHGPYEINHITWCKRFDSGAERKGEEEMLVTTGDDGVIRPWKVTTQ
ncbi:putative cytosolic iron-sulfur protein assembly protein 1 [Rhypophila decipiens]|uniref:Probable cytosolic iron-sulfur protein assembly protein 1 n=1 Tax=Rhypophila decipiens TaxID=261697 RepID=A0AAN6Y895_9PEZI|nr:putative cytosolic iron-sulfur protein assembly protein 1 [Rhypophila decipiens]